MVKNPPALETRVQSLGWEDPLEKVMATHSSILACRIPMDRGGWPVILRNFLLFNLFIFYWITVD